MTRFSTLSLLFVIALAIAPTLGSSAVDLKTIGFYKVSDSFTDSSHSFFTAALTYVGSESSYINQSNHIVKNLNFTYFFLSEERLVVKITDRDNQRWEVPNQPPFPHADYNKRLAPYENALVTVTVVNEPFSFKVTRKITGEVIFDSSAGDFIFSDYYIQLSTSLATPNIYGLGERGAQLNLGPDGTYSIFTKDNPAALEDGTSGNNLYGYHPVYLNREKSNYFSAALLRSSVPMDVVIQGGKTLTYKVIGGVVDFQFFLGSADHATPEEVIKQYHKYLGGWTLQPFWSFGFHQCRWGYHNIHELSDVLENYDQNKLPLDVLWADIDYMQDFIDFTIDEKNFPSSGMRALLNKHKKRWVPIIDAGVAIDNDIHRMGLINNVYIKDPNGTNLQGIVWPGKVNYPDFHNPNTSLFWDIGLNMLYKKVPFSGIWLDMNEASNFEPGETGYKPDPNDLLNNPPYKPAKAEDYIYTKTMRMDAVHHGGIQELYSHNLFGFLESKATYNFLKTTSDLVFILSRSSFYGSGQYAAHWTGDNVANYEHLQISIPTIIASGLFGMPMAGSDICGFSEHTTPELCARWHQLGALYPFSRNHNINNTIGQEPYALGPTVLQTAKVSLEFRYSILRHYYTEFLKQRGTGTIFRPLFFEFHTDANLYNSDNKYAENQFLIGSSLLAAPALEWGQSSVSVYFPQDNWFDFFTGKQMTSAKDQPRTIDYPAPLNTTAPVFIRGGHIIPTQKVEGVLRTDDLSNIYKLNIAFKESGDNTFVAQGNLVGIANFADDNVLIKCKYGNCLYNVQTKFTLSGNSYSASITFNTEGDSANYEEVKISGLVMMGQFSQNIGTGIKSSNVEGLKVTSASSHLVKYEFETPFVVKPGAKIEITGTVQTSYLRIREMLGLVSM